MKLRLPPVPIPVEQQALTFGQVGQRWSTRGSIARLKIKNAGIKTVMVARPPVEGVRLKDLLKFEARLRQEQQLQEAHHAS